MFQMQLQQQQLLSGGKPVPKPSSAIPNTWSARSSMGAISLSPTMAAAAILLFLLAAAPRRATGGTEYTVGDAAGWTNGPNYLAWSQKYNFTAGDTLVFNYVEGQHDVYQVTEDAFRACESVNNTKRVWVSGRDYVNLTLPGDYYYICNVEGHCLGGMKLAVSVAAAPPPPPPPPSPPMFLDPPPPPPTGSAGRRLAWPEVVRIPCLALIGLLLVA